jgi:Uma2 family endonuclease
MTILITDPALASRLRAEREATAGNMHDEVWDGVYVVSPTPNIEHQGLATRLCTALVCAIELPGIGQVFGSINISDREEDWVHNYRVPDASVFLDGNPAKDCGTHWYGGPDFAAEILSPNDLALEKLTFYASVAVRELLIINRKPWSLELFRVDADGRQLTAVDRSSLGDTDPVVSQVLSLSFRLVPGKKRPQIEVTRTDGTARWLA